MKHKWEPIPLKQGEPEKHKCKICGCVRQTYRFGYTTYGYVRSGIVYGSERPDCINWQEEDKKTID